MKLNISQLFTGLLLAFAASACGGTSGTTKTEHIEGTEWDVAAHYVVEFNDSISGISTQQDYTVADTSRVNAALKEIRHCGNVSISWTLPSPNGPIWLVAYEKEPLLSERVKVTEANSIQGHGDVVQIAFRFGDADKWAAITRESIGQRLAITVDGQLTNAPQVNMEITSGNCSVTIPSSMAQQFLPGIDMENIL